MSSTYASTPPGILTSTRTSTRENALNEQKAPPRIFHTPLEPLEPKNHDGGASTLYVSELRYAASDADEDVSTPET